MSAAFSVHLQLSAGNDFGQEFYLANPDKSPMDITGCKFKGWIQKYPGSIDAVESTSEEPVYKYIEFDTRVVDGKGGVYSLALSADATRGVRQGKYVYSVTMTDVNGFQNQVLNGLVFIDFGAPI